MVGATCSKEVNRFKPGEDTSLVDCNLQSTGTTSDQRSTTCYVVLSSLQNGFDLP